jgi:5-methylcytosine-specific restriction endonuclease McrA
MGLFIGVFSMKVTEELIREFMTIRGGYTQLTTRILGRISPSMKGWKYGSIGKELSDESLLKIRKDVARRNRKLAKRTEAHKENMTNREKKRKNKVSILPVKTKVAKIKVDIYDGDVNSSEFLQSYEWRSIRMRVLKRDGARCCCCGASAKTGAVVNVDHIKPRRKYPKLALDLNNLQVLCADCNHGKGNWDTTDWRIDHDSAVKEKEDQFIEEARTRWGV